MTVKQTRCNLPGAGPGRPKGSKNKATRELKEMILGALDRAGGMEYLAARAIDTPGPFLALVGKVLPMTVQGNLTHGGTVVSKIEFVLVDPKHTDSP